MVFEEDRTAQEPVYQILSDIRDETFRTTFAARAVAKLFLLGATYGLPAGILFAIGQLVEGVNYPYFVTAALSLAFVGLIHTLLSSWSEFRKSHFW
jgi:hypothetical protein